MGHHHEHNHMASSFNRAFAAGIALNIGFVVVEAFYGWKINSLVLLADAGHNLSDVGGLLVAWGGCMLLTQTSNTQHRIMGNA